MLRSMTGFGRVSGETHLGLVTIEMKSVNHRYLDISTRIPRELSFMEEDLKAVIREQISRGRVDVALKLSQLAKGARGAEFNVDQLREYMGKLVRLSAELDLEHKVTLEYLLTLPGVMAEPEAVNDNEELVEQVKELIRKAIKALLDSRQQEGVRLGEDISERLDLIGECVSKIDGRSESNVEGYRQRLHDNIKRLLPELQLDPTRLEVEVTLFADRSNIAEEIVRMKAHLKNFRQFLVSEQAVGRKMDFYLQEMNREANTIGSKSADVGISQLVVEIKSELEKIREQVQNLE